jgi:hypothetical protein
LLALLIATPCPSWILLSWVVRRFCFQREREIRWGSRYAGLFGVVRYAQKIDGSVDRMTEGSGLWRVFGGRWTFDTFVNVTTRRHDRRFVRVFMMGRKKFN